MSFEIKGLAVRGSTLAKISLLFVLAVSLATAQTPSADSGDLTIDRIFNSAEFMPKRIGGFKWLKGHNYATLEPSPTLKGGLDLVRYDIATQKKSVLVPAEKLVPAGASTPLGIEGFDQTDDETKILIYTNSQKVWRQNTRGDYWLLDLTNWKLTKLGGDAKASTLIFAKISPDGKRVGYVREHDIYVEEIADGKITRLTRDGSHTMINGTADWVNEEEFELRDCWRWSPDSKSIAFWQFNAEGIEDFILINNTAGLYPKLTRIPYPKAGTTNSAVRVGVVDAVGGPIRWMKTPGDLRNNYIVGVDWGGASEVIIQHMNRLQNTLQIISADPASGDVRTIFTEKDETWIDVTMPRMRWLEGGKRFLWLSERDGWKHAYSVSRDGSDLRLITPGEFDVVSVQAVDEAGGWLYYIASPEDATKRFLYRTKLDGKGAAERVSSAEAGGWNEYNMSPDSQWAVERSSSFDKYTSMRLVDLSTKTIKRTLLDNSEAQAKLGKLKRGPHEFFRIDIGDGVSLDGWMMKPPNFDPKKKYPILYYVYGGPFGTTVMDSWSGGNYFWYLMLTQQGYIVASVDNRGTPAPRGRAWRKSIYRKIGVLDSQDQANAVKAMSEKMPFIDATRVGITGASSGGSNTLHALFRYPELYKVGIALCPEASEILYDTIYTERYLGLPKDNEEDYKRAAAINHVNGLKGDLLIIHGTGDDNVHYQSTEYLMDAMIAANKQFTVMPYPNRTHNLSEGEGTTRHMYELMTRYLHQHLPAGAR